MASLRPFGPESVRPLTLGSISKRRFRPTVESVESRLLLSGDLYTVNALTDTGTGAGFTGDLRYAITQANADPGSTINITATGTDNLGSALPSLTANVTITDSDPGSFIVSGGGTGSGYLATRVNGGVTATISGLVFTNFDDTSTVSGIIGDSGSLTLNDTTLENSHAYQAGAIGVGFNDSLTANQCSFLNNSGGSGAAIQNFGNVTLNGGEVAGNTDTPLYNYGTMDLNGVEVVGNSSSSDGGAIYSEPFIFGTSDLIVTNSTIAGNSASDHGGGIYTATNTTLTNDTIANNASASGETGAGIYVNGGSGQVTLNNTIVAQNTAGSDESDIDGGSALNSSSSYNLIGDMSVGGISNGTQGNLIGTSGTPINAGLATLAANGGSNDTIALNAGSPAIGAGLVANAVDPTTSDALLYDQRGVGYARVVNGSVDIGAYQTQTRVAATTLSVSEASGTYGGTTTLQATLASGGSGVSGEIVDFELGAVDLGTTITNASGIATLSNVSLAGLNVGTYAGDVTASFAGDSSYTASSGASDLTISPAPLTITADSQTKVYGAALPTLTASYTGFVDGDTSASLVVPPTLTTTATAASHVSGSPYAITASGAFDPNYTISYVAGSLSVTSAPLTITANDQTKVYGASLPTLTVSFTGFVNGDTSASLSTFPTITTTATAASHVAGSPYAITASGVVDPDYSISYVAGSMTVTTAPLTITANNQFKVYGAALPTLTASYTGLVNGDTSASLWVLPTITTTATAASHVAGSPYAITASGVVDPDYSISYVAGSMTVTTAPLTITANNQFKVYGAALPTLTASYTGLVNGDTSASLWVLPTITTTATAASHVAGSPYAITASGVVDPDYSISYVAGSMTVTTAPLTITANNQFKVYGAALPTLTASYTGLVNGDTSASLWVLPTITTTATAASHVAGSPYAITASGVVDPDYSISYVAGSMTVTTAPLTISADNQFKVYGAALPTLTASYTGLVNGDTSASLSVLPTITTTATAASHVADSPFAIFASGAFDPDYTISYLTGTLSVTTAPLTITANNQTKVYGAALPTLTASFTGFVNGDTSASLSTFPTLSTTATHSSHVLGSPYVITASGAVDPDYTVSYVAGTLSVTTTPLTITANNQTKVYGALSQHTPPPTQGLSTETQQPA